MQEQAGFTEEDKIGTLTTRGITADLYYRGWRSEYEYLERYLNLLEDTSMEYYSPADGSPGMMQLLRAAKKLGGEVSFVDRGEPEDDGIEKVY